MEFDSMLLIVRRSSVYACLKLLVRAPSLRLISTKPKPTSQLITVTKEGFSV